MHIFFKLLFNVENLEQSHNVKKQPDRKWLQKSQQLKNSWPSETWNNPFIYGSNVCMNINLSILEELLHDKYISNQLSKVFLKAKLKL